MCNLDIYDDNSTRCESVQVVVPTTYYYDLLFTFLAWFLVLPNAKEVTTSKVSVGPWGSFINQPVDSCGERGGGFSQMTIF